LLGSLVERLDDPFRAGEPFAFGGGWFDWRARVALQTSGLLAVSLWV